VRRIIAIFLHNWPLKLAAVGLATVLYGGIVLSEGAETFNDPVPIRQPVIPPGMYLLEPPPPVTSIRYFAPTNSDQPTTDTFRATIDLSGITQGGTYDVPVQVTSVNPEIQILEVTPDIVTVQLDPLITKIVPVEIERGEVPDGLKVGTETATPSTVTVSGPKTIVDQVVAARADVVIQSSGIDIDEDVALIPVDAVGDARSPADVAPTTARISIRVFSEPETRTLPVSPVVTGTPAAGYEIDEILVEPSTVLVEGDADPLAALARVDTDPVSVSGLSETETFDTELALPEGIEAVDSVPVQITVSFRPVTESRSYTVGLQVAGAEPGLTYTPNASSVLLSVAGNPAALDTLSAESTLAQLDVAGLEPGTYDVPVTAELPAGVTLVAVSPPTVSVTVTAAVVPSPATSPAP
jgi:YbbR domain-containing protein